MAKARLIKRFGLKCMRCGDNSCTHKEYTVDHRMPLFLGGSSHISNLQLVCPPCKKKKDLQESKILKKRYE